MRRLSLLALSCAFPTLALAAPQRYEMRSYTNIGGKVQPAFAWCDAPDRVLAVTQPAKNDATTPQPVTLRRWLKRPQRESDAAPLTAPYLLGPSEGAAGQVYTRLSFPNGSGQDSPFFIRTSNVENVQDPAYRMTRVGAFRTPEGTFRCRYIPQAAFLGVTDHETVIIWENGHIITLALQRHDGKPGVYISGGKKRFDKNGTYYSFSSRDSGGYEFTYELAIWNPDLLLNKEYVYLGELRYFVGTIVGGSRNFLAYSISLPSKDATVKFERLTLHTPDPRAQRAFYTGVLGLLVETDDEAGLSLRVGSTLLRFVPGEVGGPYHFACNVPENRFAEAHAWLEERVPLLPDREGETTFYSENWDAHLTYFRDADGNIVEFIARHTLPASVGTGFGVADVLGVSELGLTVGSVPDAVAELRDRFALPLYGEASPTFTALGDEEGLLIVVPAGRGWFPTGEPARRLPFHLRARGERGTFDLEERP